MNFVSFNGQRISPSKIVCVGRNYVEHIKELDNEVPDDMVIFIKPNSAIASKLNAFHVEALHYETELCFMYRDGQFCAVALGLDLTKRGLQNKLKSKGLPWEKAKAFDGSAIFTEFIAIEAITDSLSFSLEINNEVIQEGHIGLMIHSPHAILQHILSFMTLENGDIVMTGTPKGVGEVKPRSQFRVQLMLNNQVLLNKAWRACDRN